MSFESFVRLVVLICVPLFAIGILLAVLVHPAWILLAAAALGWGGSWFLLGKGDGIF